MVILLWMIFTYLHLFLRWALQLQRSSLQLVWWFHFVGTHAASEIIPSVRLSVATLLQFMFARHCVTVQKLIEEQVEWIFFVDADMAVINPNRLIEEWIDDDVAVILYDRIMNSEVAAGSYLVKFVFEIPSGRSPLIPYLRTFHPTITDNLLQCSIFLSLINVCVIFR